MRQGHEGASQTKTASEISEAVFLFFCFSFLSPVSALVTCGCRLWLRLAVCGPVAAEVVELVVLQAAPSHAFLHHGLQLVEVVGVDLARQRSVACADAGGHAHYLAHHARGAHHAHGAQSDVGDADVAARHEEVVDVARVEAAVGYGVGVYGAVRAY